MKIHIIRLQLITSDITKYELGILILNPRLNLRLGLLLESLGHGGRQAQQVQHQVARHEVDLVVLTIAEHLKSQTGFRGI